MRYLKKTFTLFFTLFCFSLIGQTLDWEVAVAGENFEDFFGALPGDVMAVDSTTKSIYIAGFFNDTVDFDRGGAIDLHYSNGLKDIFISKIDSSGNHLWSKTMGGDFDDEAKALEIDENGNILILGYYTDTVNFNTNGGNDLLYSIEEESSTFLLKLAENGDFIWAKSIGNTENVFVTPSSVSIDGNGNIITVGSFGPIDVAQSVNDVDFDPNAGLDAITPNSSENTMYIQKLDNNGTYLWTKTILEATPNLVKVNKQNEIVIAGSFFSDVDFDPGVGVHYKSTVGTDSDYNSDVFLLKLSVNGIFDWVNTLGNYNSYPGNAPIDNVESIAIDDNGNIYTVGYFFKSNLDIDPGPQVHVIQNQGNFDAFIQKVSGDGDFLWGKGIGSAQTEHGYSITVDKIGNVYVGGSFNDELVFLTQNGTDTILSLDQPYANADAFLVKLNSNGEYVWVRDLQSAATASVTTLRIDELGNIYAHGTFSSFLTFDNIDTLNYSPANNGTTYSSFLMKLNQGPCYDLVIQLDSLQDISCSQNGFAAVSVAGVAPFDYSWNTLPVSLDSTAFFENSGFYTFSVADSRGCEDSATYFIPGVSLVNNFDFDAGVGFSGVFRPGETASLFLDVWNNGCVPESGLIKLVYDTAVSFVSAEINPQSTNGDTLIWSFDQITLDSLHFNSFVQFAIDSTATLGQMVCFEIIVEPLVGDFNPVNNQKSYCIELVNSFDPNDKQVFPQGNCDPNYTLIDSKLRYTVRFQNTGNAEAINVSILDTIDSNLNINSLKLLSSSHEPLYIEKLSSNVLSFNFDNINLPDSGSNPLESIGYVIFEVEPNLGLVDGSSVENKAGIYFDFNDPIFTNTTLNTYVNEIPMDSNYVEIVGCDSVYLNGEFYLNSQRFTEIFQNQENCDSLVTYDVIINNSTLEINTITACDSVFFNNHLFLTSQTLIDTFNTITTCDSIIITYLNINHSDFVDQEIVACDSVTLNGQVFYNSLSLNDTLQNMNLCDSIIHYDIAISNSSIEYLSDTILSDESYFLPSGLEISETGIYFDTLITNNNCDSIFVIDLLVENNVDIKNVQTKGINWSIQPNPATNYFFIELINPKEQFSIQILNKLGQAVYTKLDIENENKIFTKNLSAGIYFVILKSNSGKFLKSKKVLIEK